MKIFCATSIVIDKDKILSGRTIGWWKTVADFEHEMYGDVIDLHFPQASHIVLEEVTDKFAPDVRVVAVYEMLPGGESWRPCKKPPEIISRYHSFAMGG